jgi:hypothetical protein
MGMEEILQCAMDHADETFARQIQYILEQLLSEAVDEELDEDEDEDVDVEVRVATIKTGDVALAPVCACVRVCVCACVVCPMVRMMLMVAWTRLGVWPGR